MFSKLAIGQFFIIITMAGIGYVYFKHTQSQINTLISEKTELISSVTRQENVIKNLKDFQETQNTQTTELQERLNASEIRRRDAERKLREANWEFEARRNRKETEDKINQRLSQEFKSIETITNLTSKNQPQNLPQDHNSQPTPSPPKKWEELKNE